MPVHRDHARADIPQDVVGLEPDPPELDRERLLLHPRLAEAVAEHRDDREDDVEDQDLGPERRVGRAGVGQEDVGEEHRGREHRGERAPGRRHEQERVGRHEQHVQRGEGRLRLAREVDDRGDHAQVHQRLDEEKRVPRRPAPQNDRPRPVGGEHERDDHRDADEKRFLGPLGPDQPGAEEHADGQHQAPDEQPGQQRPLVGKRASAGSGWIGVGQGGPRMASGCRMRRRGRLAEDRKAGVSLQSI